MRNRLGLAAATVAISWWVAVLGWGLATGRIGPGALDASMTLAAFVVVGAVLGAGGIGWWIAADRQARREDLVTHDVRGLVSSIGEVPFLAKAPPEAATLPDLTCPDVPDSFYPRWFARYSSSHPLHVALAKRILRIYGAHAHLPAGFEGDRMRGGQRPHGGRTLVQHAMLCAFKMHTIGRTFDYKGVFSEKGRTLLSLRDPNYTFDPDHPLLMITALAHDIGKIEAFKFDADGKVIGIHREHDLTGARMLARLEETWALPDEDRMALILSVGHYHAAKHLPLAPDRQAIDDRTVALMELLALADRQASAIEYRGYELTKEELAAQIANDEAVPGVIDALLAYEAFLSEVANAAVINSKVKKENLGWLCNVKGANRPWLAINEENMAAAVARRLGLANYDAKDGSGKREITVALLGELGRREVLATGMKLSSGEFVEHSPTTALWRVVFTERKAGKDVDWLGPLVLYFVDPNKVPIDKSVAMFKHPAVIASSVTGNAGRRTKRSTGGTAGAATSPAPDALDGQVGHGTVEAQSLGEATDERVGAEHAQAQSSTVAPPVHVEEPQLLGVDPTRSTIGRSPPRAVRVEKKPKPAHGAGVPVARAPRQAAPDTASTARAEALAGREAEVGPADSMTSPPVVVEQAAPAPELKTFGARPPLVSELPNMPGTGSKIAPSAKEVAVAATTALALAAHKDLARLSIYHAQDGKSYAELTCEMLEAADPMIPWKTLRGYLLALRERDDAAWRIAVTSDDATYVLRLPVVSTEPSADSESESAL